MVSTYIDGAGRERCAETGKEVSECYCSVHRSKKQKQRKTSASLANEIAIESTRKRSDRTYRSKQYEVQMGDRIPQVGDKLNVVNTKTGEQMGIEVAVVHSVEWLDDSRAGVSVDMSYYILESNLYVKSSQKRVH